jgi:hypothetical protein
VVARSSGSIPWLSTVSEVTRNYRRPFPVRPAGRLRASDGDGIYVRRLKSVVGRIALAIGGAVLLAPPSILFALTQTYPPSGVEVMAIDETTVMAQTLAGGSIALAVAIALTVAIALGLAGLILGRRSSGRARRASIRPNDPRVHWRSIVGLGFPVFLLWGGGTWLLAAEAGFLFKTQRAPEHIAAWRAPFMAGLLPLGAAYLAASLICLVVWSVLVAVSPRRPGEPAALTRRRWPSRV